MNNKKIKKVKNTSNYMSNANEYKNNFLTNIIFRLDFPQISDYNRDNLKKFRELIKSYFPILEEPPMKVFEISNLGEDKKIDLKTSDIIKWNFWSKDKKMLASIEQNSLTFEIIGYEKFEKIYELIEFLIDKLETIFSTIISIRIGLRYINQIKLDEEDPLNFKDYIKDNLISQIDFFETSLPIRVISSIEISNENQNLIFKFGIPNSTYPNGIINKEFVLDYDCYTNDSLDKEEILERIKIFKETIVQTFEESIKDKLREKMKE